MVASSWKRKIRPSYDAIVIGTGFGGAVAACRLVQAGLSVAVLERGRRYDINPFPRNWNNPFDGWLWSSGHGLFDVKLCQEMAVVQAAGLGCIQELPNCVSNGKNGPPIWLFTRLSAS
jgi:choline dehydrogenase-like flavoprotein